MPHVVCHNYDVVKEMVDRLAALYRLIIKVGFEFGLCKLHALMLILGNDSDCIVKSFVLFR